MTLRTTDPATRPETDQREDTVEVSFVMPVLNEAASVQKCVERGLSWLADNGVSGEVVVADNGSTDGSQGIAAAAGARVVDVEARGYGSASLAGIRAARGRYIVTADADATYDFAEAGLLIDRLKQGNDLVLGNRLEGNLQEGAMPWLHRHVGTPAISFLLRTICRTNVRDSQSGYRAMKREAAESLDLVSTGMEFASEMILKAERRGLRIAEVPITYSPRAGESKLQTLRDGWRHLKLLLLLAPEATFLTIAIVLFLGGVAIQLIAAGVYEDLSWQPVFLGTILMVLGLNAFVVGGIAKLHAVKKGLLRPDWLVRLFQSRLGLEVMGGVAIVLFLAGLGIDLAVYLSWLGGSRDDFIWQASLAQALILLGANLGMVTLVVGLFEAEA
jgi:glycosyltransferase involved in cell wall biosynthesis